MRHLHLPLPAFPVLITLAVAAMLGLQGLVEYRLLEPLSDTSARLSDSIHRLRAKAATNTPTSPKASAQLEDIMARLDTQDVTTARIERLHQMAAQHGVLLRKASYRSQAAPGNLVRHEMTADISGAYPDIRQFLRTLLAQDQAVAVDALAFSRPNGGLAGGAAAGVRAQLRLSLYSRSMAS